MWIFRMCSSGEGRSEVKHNPDLSINLFYCALASAIWIKIAPSVSVKECSMRRLSALAILRGSRHWGDSWRCWLGFLPQRIYLLY
jgi:hypothetical protein